MSVNRKFVAFVALQLKALQIKVFLSDEFCRSPAVAAASKDALICCIIITAQINFKDLL